MKSRIRTATAITVVLAAAVAMALASGVASAAIYWQNNGEEIGRANLDGSNPDPDFISVPFAGSVVVCGGVAVDGAHIYWADNQQGTIARANLDGSQVDNSFITGANSPCGVAIDSAHVYWTNLYGESIGRADLDGTEAQQHFIEVESKPCGLASTAANLYWGVGDVDPMGRAAIDGSEQTEEFIPHSGAGCGLAAAGEYLYWTNFDGFIGRAKINGTEVEPSFISGLRQPCGIAVHGDELYWSEQPFAEGSISKASLDGSGVQRILSGIPSPCGIAVDDTFVPPEPETRVERPRVTFRPIRNNRRRSTILVGVNVSKAGSLQVTAPRGIHARLLGGSSEVGPGRHWLKLSVAAGPKGSWPQAQLRRNRHVQFTLAVGLIATNGETGLKVRRMDMWRAHRLPRRPGAPMLAW